MFNVRRQFTAFFPGVFPDAAKVRLSIPYYLIKSAFYIEFSFI